MSVSLPTEPGDPISQSNASDVNGDFSSNGNYSAPTNDGSAGDSTSLEADSATGSGTPLLYFLMFVWLIWIVLFMVWIPLLVAEIDESLNGNDLKSGPQLAVKRMRKLQAGRNYKYQRHKESGSQMTMTLLLLFATAIGLGLSIFANLSCDFVQLDESLTLEWKLTSEEDYYRIMNEGGDNIVNTGDTLRLQYYSLGLWALGLSSSKSNFLGGGDSYQDSCFSISQTESLELGWQFQLARVASVAASVLGGLSFLFLFTGCCCPSQRGYFHYLTLPFVLATISQSLTLFLLDTTYCTSLTRSNNCEMGLGAVASISAALYWLFGTLASMTPFPPIAATFAPLPSEEEPNNLSDQL
eukprot:CAMPEP_0113604292 /NCGR_PEP_ID=MMETSP0017_2-20120614/1721_1 /TAXON_ID=2856 /ORGANISM="Cylindrotheca closterium" /LENGTH=354 /DNA_ID=CAMNT_0000512715 /DNA_START=196 /DNA_END=1261 /DNA_ORIENTATION=- /assembly_acc=CAM_ASM_000147